VGGYSLQRLALSSVAPCRFIPARHRGFHPRRRLRRRRHGGEFEVTYDPVSHTATWTNLDNNLGDQPITDIALDSNTGDLFVSTDFGVNMLRSGGTQCVPAAGSLPPAAVYGLTIDSNARVLYAATHGRGAWKLDLN